MQIVPAALQWQITYPCEGLLRCFAPRSDNSVILNLFQNLKISKIDYLFVFGFYFSAQSA